MRLRHLALLIGALATWGQPGFAQSPKPPAKPKPAKPKIALASWAELSHAAADIARLQFYVDHLERRGNRCREYRRLASCSTIQQRALQRVVEAEKHLKRLRSSAISKQDAAGIQAVQNAQALLRRVEAALLAVGPGPHIGQTADRYDQVRATLVGALSVLDAEHAYAERPDATLTARATALRAGLEIHLSSGAPLKTATLERIRKQSQAIARRRRALESSPNTGTQSRLRRARGQFLALETAVSKLGTNNDPGHILAVKNAAAALARALT